MSLYNLFKSRRMRSSGQEACHRGEIKINVSCQTHPLGVLGVDGELYNTHTNTHNTHTNTQTHTHI